MDIVRRSKCPRKVSKYIDRLEWLPALLMDVLIPSGLCKGIFTGQSLILGNRNVSYGNLGIGSLFFFLIVCKKASGLHTCRANFRQVAVEAAA